MAVVCQGKPWIWSEAECLLYLSGLCWLPSTVSEQSLLVSRYHGRPVMDGTTKCPTQAHPARKRLPAWGRMQWLSQTPVGPSTPQPHGWPEEDLSKDTETCFSPRHMPAVPGSRGWTWSLWSKLLEHGGDGSVQTALMALQGPWPGHGAPCTSPSLVRGPGSPK